MIDNVQRELFARAVLKVLDANNTRFGLMAAALRLLVRQFGFDPTEGEVKDLLEYLTDKGLVSEVAKVLGKANRAWKITDEGRSFWMSGICEGKKTGVRIQNSEGREGKSGQDEQYKEQDLGSRIQDTGVRF